MVAVTRRRKPGIDPRTGDPAAGGTVETVLQAIAVWPADADASTVLDERARNGTREELVVGFADVDVDLDPRTDTLVHAGEDYRLDGRPQKYSNPHAPGAKGATVKISRAIG